MSFEANNYVNFVSTASPSQERLFLQYIGPRNDFDIIVVGSGIGGGILADDLAERLGANKRILVLEAGSYLYPTHVYNICRFPNSSIANHFGCDTFWQTGNSDSQFFIGGKPQLGLGGRSVFWSGLIPTIQPWELEFFPPNVRQALAGGLLDEAGESMNQSRTMGATAFQLKMQLQQSSLAEDFIIEETPRALHQPYLEADGSPSNEMFLIPTGVFNTAELLINQLGLTPGVSHGDFNGLQLLLNAFVEDVQNHGSHFQLVVRNTLNGSLRSFQAPTVVLAGGSVESPKLLRRSSMFPGLPKSVQDLVGRGLTDHPTTSELTGFATDAGPVHLSRTSHAKIVFYSKGLPDPNNPGQIRYPFNVEMNLNHEYWHLRENDPTDTSGPGYPNPGLTGPSRIDIKFSFGNCLDEGNVIDPAPPFGYVPKITFHNQKWMDRLRDSRFPALAGWQKDYNQIFDVLNEVSQRIFAEFQIDGSPVKPQGAYGQDGKAFGFGTVHHAAGSLRMPYRPGKDGDFQPDSVVDEDLRVIGTNNLYVCDMSVMPFSSAANPVRTLAALALRLSKHFFGQA